MNTESYDLSDVPNDGYYDSVSQYWLIRKEEEFEENPRIDFLEIGGPGVDGIGFGKRKGMKKIPNQSCHTTEAKRPFFHIDSHEINTHSSGAAS